MGVVTAPAGGAFFLFSVAAQGRRRLVVIVLKDVCAGYGKKEVLERISLTFDRGEMAALLGPNGSGKTTLLLTLSGGGASEGRVH